MKNFKYCIFLCSFLLIAACGNDKKDRNINLDEEMEKIHEKEPLQEQEEVDHFIGIPIFEPADLKDREISDGPEEHLMVRSYTTTEKDLLKVYEFYKTELPKTGWKLDENRTTAIPKPVIYAEDGAKKLNIRIDEKTDSEDEDSKTRFHITLIIPK